MPRYKVDVKAFINITVEAESKSEAARTANDYVQDGLTPDEFEFEGWNQSLKYNEETASIVSTTGFVVDGYPDVELADD